MDETTWLVGDNPLEMLELLRSHCTASRTKVGRRRLRLFCCACARRIWHLLSGPARDFVEGIEKDIEGRLTPEEYKRLHEAVYRRHQQDLRRPEGQRSGVIWTVASTHYLVQMAMGAASQVSAVLAQAALAERQVARAGPMEVGATVRQVIETESRCHAELLRDLFGNPFRPLPKRRFPADLRGLAEACHEDPIQMSLLADVLADLGEEAAEHCRLPEHVKGCHVVDWVRGVAG
jgi:hypothetical protein